jgi:DNA primase
MSFCVRRNTYRCFACGAHGGTIDLAMHLLGKPFLDACRWLAEGAYLPCSIPERERESQQKERPFDASRYARYFEHPWLNDAARKFLFEERRLDPRVVRWCRLSSWQDRKGVAWLQIPYYSQDGRLIGIQNRNLTKGAMPRFRFPAGAQCGIYNLPVLNRLRPADELWITEGCSDCWAMLSAGHKAIAIPSATLLGRKDVELLTMLSATLSTRFHMYPDSDAPGERLFLQLQQVLPTIVHHQLPPGYKDFSDYYVACQPAITTV